MRNPRPPRQVRYATVPEVRSQLDTFLGRLDRLGATDDEMAAVAEHWDQFDADWTPERRAELVGMPDSALRRAIAAVSIEYADGTSATPDADQAAADEADAAALAEATARIGQSVTALLGWVGADPVRARAVVTAELARTDHDERPMRRTLLGPLQAV